MASVSPLVVAVGLFLASAAPGPEPVVIGNFPIERSADVAPHRIRLQFSNYSGSRYGELSRRKVLIGKPGSVLEVDLRKLDAPARDRPGRGHRRCSFAIDCDEASVVRTQQELVQRFGEKAAPPQIERFVDEFI